MKRAEYIFSEEKFIENYNNIKNCFNKYFDNVIFAYSMKTNSSSVVMKVAKKLNLMCECVSDYEVLKAINIYGFNKSEIIYNGVIPDVENKINIAENNGIYNVDNITELEEVISLCNNRNDSINIGLRINWRNDGSNSRFGIIPDDNFYNLVDTINKSKTIKVKGLHIHTYGDRSIEFSYNKAYFIGKIASLLDLEYIDFGSGLPSDNFNGKKVDYESYAKCIYYGLKEHFTEKKIPRIIFELGIPLVSNAIVLKATIINKYRTGQKINYISNISKHKLGFMKNNINIFYPGKIKKCNGLKRTIYGYTCIEDDIISDKVETDLKIGDVFYIENMGAYTISLLENFINKNELIVK